MSMMLNLVECLLSRGRMFLAMGQDRDAWRVLHTLSKLGGLPIDAAEETQLLLAGIRLNHGHHAPARRHFALALMLRPDNARTHHLMATACAGGDRPAPKRAARHFRLALKLDAKQPACLRDFGLFLLEQGHRTAAIRALREAAEVAGDDPVVVGTVAEALFQVGKERAARQLLRTALFRNSRDRRFHRLWLDYQYRKAARSQQHTSASEQPIEAEEKKDVVLPFLRPEPTSPAAANQRMIRRDQGAALPRPHFRSTNQFPDTKHA